MNRSRICRERSKRRRTTLVVELEFDEPCPPLHVRGRVHVRGEGGVTAGWVEGSESDGIGSRGRVKRE